ncbi:MAG: transglutaminase-like domain-containing protein [Aquincola tertiaricarbonis]|uniref:transglutaminase-like domain-containing protein n=1 Tax=Aquincola TaxID=391952 RepID=UPI000614EAC4|nr:MULTISPECIES: transglutaminase family protein [Aquincola]MCR5869030.1 transglutaminase family protein [Aquincola sp. J276]
MIHIQLNVELSYQVERPGADFVLNFHPALTPAQGVAEEVLTLSQPITPRLDVDPRTQGRYLRLRAQPGELTLRYSSLVTLTHHRSDPWGVPEIPVADLPLEVISYIYPSRYCPSDRLGRFAISQFGHLPQGYRRVQAIRDWVRNHVAFTSNTSNSSTSALDTLTDQVGVCRDFAHLMIALCRALSIPARMTTGTDFGADPTLGPPDFHAYVEVYLGHRWYIFDPSGTAIPMGLIRIGVGRDAADVAFATIFGSVKGKPPVLRAVAIEDAVRGFSLPFHCMDALSTDAALLAA